MKKTLVALAIAGVATSAQAKIELFKDDASQVTAKAEIATYLYTSDVDYKDNTTVADVKTDLDVNAWAKVQFDFEHNVTDTLVAGGTFEIQSGTGFNKADNNAEFDDVAAYLKGDFGTIGLGEIGDVADSNDAVNKTDILNELDNNYLAATASDSKGHGVSYSNAFGPVEVTVDAYTAADKKTDNKYGLGVNYAADMFSVGAMYQTWGDDTSASAVADNEDYKSATSWAISADVTPMESLTLAANYGVASADDVKDIKRTTVSGSFAATEAATLYAVYGMEDNGSSDDGSEFILGASYAASDLLTVFTEFASRDDHNTADTTEMLVGAYFDF